MPDLTQEDIIHLYRTFSSPILDIHCGEKCKVYNEHHSPFCCDIHSVIPSAYYAEWDYLRNQTSLWQLYKPDDCKKQNLISEYLPENQVPIICQGHEKCQREFRSISCRSFPFFPYIDQKGDFIGLTYYWEYEDCCWLINHLHLVSPRFRDEFVAAYEYLMKKDNQEFANFRYQSIIMRRVFGKKKRSIPLIGRASTPQLQFYKVSPRNGRMRKVDANAFSKFGYYYYSNKLPFPDE
ncbi:MAG: hypothetical protein ABFD51_11625 [Anaerolineaceae bacterium]